MKNYETTYTEDFRGHSNLLRPKNAEIKYTDWHMENGPDGEFRYFIIFYIRHVLFALSIP